MKASKEEISQAEHAFWEALKLNKTISTAFRMAIDRAFECRADQENVLDRAGEGG